MRVREATPADVPAVLNVLDGAALATDHDHVRTRTTHGDVLVAHADSGETVLGALVLDGDRITAVAVRPNRRGQGIGTTLVETAADRRERLTAEFDVDVRPFYEQLGFTVEPAEDDGRLSGVWIRE